MRNFISATVVALLVLSGVNAPAYSQMSQETLQNKSITRVSDFFPRIKGSFIGDPMPCLL
ncbi:glycosyl hydrolase, partial [Enterobacter sp. 63]